MDTIRKVEYFSIVVPDTPGQTFKVLQTLVGAGVNLIACNGFPRGGKALIDVVPDDVEMFNSAKTSSRACGMMNRSNVR